MDNAATLLGLLIVVSACTDVFVMASKELGTERRCQAPPLMQNIIGTWRFGQKLRQGEQDTLARSVLFTVAKLIDLAG